MSESNLNGKRILAVDDEADVLETLEELIVGYPEFLEDVITLGHRSNLKKMFQRLGGVFDKRFSSQWMEDEKTFWDQVCSGDYRPESVIL